MKKKCILLNCWIMGIIVILFFIPEFINGQIMKTDNIICKIEPMLEEYKATDGLILKYTLSNTTGSAINVVKWNTPVEGINADIFNVQSNNENVVYVGKTIKRGKPRPEDYITIEPNESISGEINLEDAYYITNSGDYSIELNTVLLDLGHDTPEELSTKQDFDSRSLRSNKITLKLIEDKNLPKLDKMYPKEDESPKTPAFIGCTQNQQTILKKALTNAQLSSFGAYTSLSIAPVNKRPTAARYNYWFGAYNSFNYNTVLNHFDAIYKALINNTITFHCDCEENYYAYVYPSKPYHIYICNAFWSAPATGTDSQMGTIIHEVSHFYAVTSTKDYVYGQAGAHNLANSDPSKAINNADNYEYFAENTPNKPMPVGLNLTLFSFLLVIIITTIVLIIRHKKHQFK